jgi:hypothetical protein
MGKPADEIEKGQIIRWKPAAGTGFKNLVNRREIGWAFKH